MELSTRVKRRPRRPGGARPAPAAEHPYRLVTNTTSRSRAMLVKRLRDYGFGVVAEELFTATLAGADVGKDAGYSCVAPFLPEAALADMGDLELCGGTSGRGRPDSGGGASRRSGGALDLPPAPGGLRLPDVRSRAHRARPGPVLAARGPAGLDAGPSWLPWSLPRARAR